MILDEKSEIEGLMSEVVGGKHDISKVCSV